MLKSTSGQRELIYHQGAEGLTIGAQGIVVRVLGDPVGDGPGVGAVGRRVQEDVVTRGRRDDGRAGDDKEGSQAERKEA